jgi:imidazolonepropionase
MLPLNATQPGSSTMEHWDVVIRDARIATMRDGERPYGVIEDAALAIRDGRIAWLGANADLPPFAANKTRSIGRQWLTPALIDCHTHLLFGGNRASEFEQRLEGASYEDIARAGGGIMATVRATRAASDDELLASGAKRLGALRREGVATVEIKSGYGLDFDSELRLLRLARELGRKTGVGVRTTFLGAHAVPTDYGGDADAYVDFLCDELLPAVYAAQLADAVDAYCETIAFSSEQVARLFARADALGLPVKLHADQLSDCGGARLAARFHALSADHLEYTPDDGIAALAGAACVAVLLPGAFVTLREKRLPPMAALRRHNVPIAIATDCNPGTSPICSLRSIMSLATSQFLMTPEECLAGVTRNAARALGLHADRGTLATGMRADIAQWDIGHPSELSYWIGLNELTGLFIEGNDIIGA